MGWPTLVNKVKDMMTIRYMAKVVERVWTDRYGKRWVYKDDIADPKAEEDEKEDTEDEEREETGVNEMIVEQTSEGANIRMRTETEMEAENKLYEERKKWRASENEKKR